MTPSEQPFTIILDDDDANVAEGKLPGADAGPTWAKHRVTVQLDEGDTAGHSIDASSVSITLHFDDDVEGHALSLHFPDARKADEFRRRLLATGVVAGALVVGVTAAQLSGTMTATSVGTGAIVAPAPAAAQPLVNPRIPADDLVVSIAAPAAAQPLVNPRIPAEDLAPIAAPAAAQPLVNPRIPAEDLAPIAVPDGASGAKLPASHISSAAPADTITNAQTLPGSHHTR
jgi:hypothetical protein